MLISQQVGTRLDQVEKNILSAIKDSKSNKDVGKLVETKIQKMEQAVVCVCPVSTGGIFE